jgi:uncharacterized repeat protein (TIGR03803 family)
MKISVILFTSAFFFFLQPHCQVTQELWAATGTGGSGDGNLIKVDSDGGNITNTYSFSALSNGQNPNANLLQATNEKIYGTTNSGGSNNLGVLFEYDPAFNIFTPLIHFDGLNNGASPSGGLLQADNGKIYGTTSEGGLSDKGVLFEYNLTDSSFTKLIDFEGTLNGSFPTGGLIQAANGLIYGLTTSGGVNNLGCIFEFNIFTSSLSNIHDFDGATNGASPYAGLIEAADGNLYGLTSAGGSADLGVIFKLETTGNVYTKLIDFDGANYGANPQASFLEASDGNLYGLTRFGGTNNVGALFEYNYSGSSFTKLLDFDGANNGSEPIGNLIESTNGKLYGLTNTGGLNDFGVLFEYDYASPLYVKKHDFDGGLVGKNPSGGLALLSICYGATSTILDTTVCDGTDFLFPDGSNAINLQADTTQISILTTMSGCDSIITTQVNVVYIPNDLFVSGYNIYTPEDMADSYQWLDCNNGYAQLPGTFQGYGFDSLCSYAVQIEKNGCIDTSECEVITKQTYYDDPYYSTFVATVFCEPATGTDTCNAMLMAWFNGGVTWSMQFLWHGQPYSNVIDQNVDYGCTGIYSLDIVDHIGDTVTIDYYVTDTANFDVFYDFSFTGFIDTLFLAASNCTIDYGLPIDSAFFSDFVMLYPDTVGLGSFYLIEVGYYQAGVAHYHADTVYMLDAGGIYMVDFSVYCPTKSNGDVKVFRLSMSYPEILGLHDQQKKSGAKLYPNPVADALTIELVETFIDGSIEISDMSGRVIMQETNINGNSILLNLSELKSGTFILKIYNDKIFEVHTFVKN